VSPPRKPQKRTTCAVCCHTERVRIESLRVAGASFRTLTLSFGVHRDALWRHMKDHVDLERRAALMVGPAQLEALGVQAAAESRSLMERMNIMTGVLFKRFIACAEEEDDNALANIAGKLNVLFKDYARLTGELRDAAPSTVSITNNLNVFASPQFVALQDGLLAIARQHPSARQAIIDLLRQIDSRPAMAKPNGGGHAPLKGEVAHVS